MNHVQLQDIIDAADVLTGTVNRTPLQKNKILSERYDCNVYLKREDLQVIRSFKIRGAYNMIHSLSKEQLKNGVVCASAGNHAQGVAFSCNQLEINCKIFMPSTTPRQKVSQVKRFGGPFVQVILTGDTFDDSFNEAMAYCNQQQMAFVHPFDDALVIAGQGTVGMEILQQLQEPIDYVFGSIGGGGLMSGVGTYVKQVSPTTNIIGVEPQGAASMKAAFEKNDVVSLTEIDSFVDGAAVKQVGHITLEICKKVLDDIILVAEGKACTSILELYNENAIVVEPAGALPIAALDMYRDRIKGTNVVCIISGGNNDIDRMQEIKEKSLIYEGLKHYFVVNFPQRAGALRQFVGQVLGENDDITLFEYTKKHNKDSGPVLLGIELKHKEDYQPLIERMQANGFQFLEINNDPYLFNMLI